MQGYYEEKIYGIIRENVLKQFSGRNSGVQSSQTRVSEQFLKRHSNMLVSVDKCVKYCWNQGKHGLTAGIQMIRLREMTNFRQSKSKERQ